MTPFEWLVVIGLLILVVGSFEVVRTLSKIHETLIERLPARDDDDDLLRLP